MRCCCTFTRAGCSLSVFRLVFMRCFCTSTGAGCSISVFRPVFSCPRILCAVSRMHHIAASFFAPHCCTVLQHSSAPFFAPLRNKFFHHSGACFNPLNFFPCCCFTQSAFSILTFNPHTQSAHLPRIQNPHSQSAYFSRIHTLYPATMHPLPTPHTDLRMQILYPRQRGPERLNFNHLIIIHLQPLMVSSCTLYFVIRC